ncbi:MAG: phage tail tube protein [Nitrospinota bacterium]
MATKRITTGWRVFSIIKESSYGNTATLGTAFNFEGPITDLHPNEVQTDENEVTGLNEPAIQEILNWKLDGSHQQRAMPHNLAHFLSLVMGKVTTDQPDNINDPTVYRHFIERDLDNINLPSLTMVEYDGIAAKRFTGLFGKSVKVSGERGDFVKLEAQFGGMGKEEFSSDLKPTVVGESYLRYGDVNFTRGGSLTGSVAAGDLSVGGSPVSFQGDLQSFEWTIDNQANPIYEMGDGSGFVSRVERGDKYKQSLSAVLEMQDDSHKTGLINGTPYVLNIPITGSVISGGSGTFNFSCDIVFPKVVYKEAKKDRDGDIVTVNAEFQVLEDETYGSVIVKIINQQTHYLS